MAQTTTLTSKPVSWFYSVVKPAVAPFLVTRAIILIIALVLQWLLDTGRIIHYAFIADAPLSVLSATFDANWFASIAYEGYDFTAEAGQQSNIHFMPLFPLLMRVVGTLLGLSEVTGGYNLAGVLVSHIAFFAVLVLLYHLTRLVWDDEKLASNSMWLAALLPWSFVFSMTYTESLFLALSLGSLLLAYKARSEAQAGIILLAGILAALAALTRHQGVFVACCTAWIVAVAPPNLNLITRARNLLLAGVPAALAFAGYVVYIGINSRELLAVFSAHDAWGDGYLGDLHRLFVLPPANQSWPMDLIETTGLIAWVAASITALVMLYVAYKKRIMSLQVLAYAFYTVVSIGYLLIAHTANQSWGRYMMVVFPCIWAFAWLLKKQNLRILAPALMAMQCIFFAAAVLLQATP